MRYPGIEIPAKGGCRRHETRLRGLGRCKATPPRLGSAPRSSLTGEGRFRGDRRRPEARFQLLALPQSPALFSSRPITYDPAARWRDLGATHISVNVTGLGMASPQAHIRRLGDVKALLG